MTMRVAKVAISPVVSLKLEAITPKHLPTSQEYRKAIERAVQKSANLTKRDYESTARTWSAENKPEFTVTVEESGGDYSVTAGTDSKIYGYVDEGTEPHTIRAKKSRFLRFRTGGTPKTRVGIIGSRAGSPGTDWRTAQEVRHPGTKKRNFTETIRKRRQKTIEQEISQAVAVVARKQA